MSKSKGENKKLGYLRDLVEAIVDTSQKVDDMPPLETEKDEAKKQKGQGLKILTPLINCNYVKT